MRAWQIQAAKAQSSALVQAAFAGEPQLVTVHGRPMAVVLSASRYEHLRRRKPGLVEFLRRSPLAGVSLKVVRDRSAARRVKL